MHISASLQAAPISRQQFFRFFDCNRFLSCWIVGCETNISFWLKISTEALTVLHCALTNCVYYTHLQKQLIGAAELAEIL